MITTGKMTSNALAILDKITEFEDPCGGLLQSKWS